MRIKSIRCFCVLLGALLFFPSLTIADDETLPVPVFSAIMLKALSYDRNIDRQGKDKINIGIVYFSDDQKSLDFAGSVRGFIASVQSLGTLKDKTVGVVSLPMARGFDISNLEDQLKQNNISVLVADLNDEAYVRIVLEAAQKLQISSVCGDTQCEQAGVSLVIIKREDKPQMLINLDSVKKEGSDYNSKFLSMCDVQK